MSSAGPSSGGVPPRNYVCKRCLIPGHFYQDCPVKDSMATRTTGIPRSFLTPANPNDPGAKVNPQGLVMVNKNDKVVYDEVMERQRKVSESDSNQQSYGQLVESQLQARMQPTLPAVPSSKPAKQINYRTAPNKTFVHARFLLECGNKLNAKVMTVATALSTFHKFCRAASTNITEYDPYLMGSACLYLAGKIEDNDHLRLRDIINVVWTTLHPEQEPLPLDSEYYNMRDAIVQAELHILRMIGFQPRHKHPHRYLLQYLKTLRDWMPETTWEKFPLAKTSWSVLQDAYHDQNVVLDSDPSELSLACIQLALQSFGLQVPLTNEGSTRQGESWMRILNSECSKDKIWDVMTRLMDLYNHDAMFISPYAEDPNKDAVHSNFE